MHPATAQFDSSFAIALPSGGGIHCFNAGGSKSAQQRPHAGLGMCNLRRSRFCAIVSSNLPRIENPR